MNITLKTSGMFLCAIMLFAGCAKEKLNAVNERELIDYTFQANIAKDIETKVGLDVDGSTPTWEVGDRILVLDAEERPVGTDGIFSISEGSGTISGLFKGQLYAGQEPAFAVYPANAASVSECVVTYKLLTSAEDRNTGTVKPAIMLGKFIGTWPGFMVFVNPCAVLKINTGNYGKQPDGGPAIKAVTISASYGSVPTPVAGTFTIDWNNEPSIVAASDADNEIAIELPDELQTYGQDVYIPIFPLLGQDSTKPTMNFSFENTTYGRANVEYTFKNVIKANTIYFLGEAKGLDWE